RLYGLLQDEETFGNKDPAQARGEAKQRLAALNRNGTFGKRLEFVLPALLRDMPTPISVGLLLAPAFIFYLNRIGAASRLARLSKSSLWCLPVLQKNTPFALLASSAEWGTLGQAPLQTSLMMSRLPGRFGEIASGIRSLLRAV